MENVIPYYEPLLPAKKRDRHLYWTNFHLPSTLSNRLKQFSNIKDDVKMMSTFHDFDFTKYEGNQRINKIARNLVDYEAGKTILEVAFGIYQSNNKKQTSLFAVG